MPLEREAATSEWLGNPQSYGPPMKLGWRWRAFLWKVERMTRVQVTRAHRLSRPGGLTEETDEGAYRRWRCSAEWRRLRSIPRPGDVRDEYHDLEADERLTVGSSAGTRKSTQLSPASSLTRNSAARRSGQSIPSARPLYFRHGRPFVFNTSEPYDDRAHIIDRDGRIVRRSTFRPASGRRPRPRAGPDYAETMLDGRRLKEVLSSDCLYRVLDKRDNIDDSPRQRDRSERSRKSVS